MKNRGIIRAVKYSWSRNFLLLRLYSVDEAGNETVVATSSPVTKVAAAGVCRLFQDGAPLRLDIDALTRVLRTPGKTAWAGFTAFEPARAALKACLQHDEQGAKAALVIITLSLDSNVVNDVSSVLDVVYPHFPPSCEIAFVTAYDESQENGVRVEILLMNV